MSELPLVSIVTPSFNMAQFLEETIQSVLSQDYPRIEYFVIDGGSTDGSLEILRRYDGKLRFESAPDRGTADAINKGFRMTSGEIFAYLNADDVYRPGAVSAAVERLRSQPEAAVVYGDAMWIDASGATIGAYPTRDFDKEMLASECFICQPAAFLRRNAFEATGGMDPNLQFTFDYDLWIRMARTFRLVHVPDQLAMSRMHPKNKSLGCRRQFFKERIQMLRREVGYAAFAPVYAYACHLLDRRDQFFQPLQPSVRKYALSLLLGLKANGLLCGRFIREWARVMKTARHNRRRY